MRGAPLQTTEEREAGLAALEEREREDAALAAALDKIKAKILATKRHWNDDLAVQMTFTMGELKALRQFGRKFSEV